MRNDAQSSYFSFSGSTQCSDVRLTGVLLWVRTAGTVWADYQSTHTGCDVNGNNCLACDANNTNCERIDTQYGSDHTVCVTPTVA